MPLHGKVVVIKRSGGDGTEFPLTAACTFGRKPECDIRIQLPHVSKEHCRIDFNENKEVILTNLSSVNPTCVNGQILAQPERLKHGDVITIVDRSFRFEYPPAPTPKKRSSRGGKSETLKVLQSQQVEAQGGKRLSEVSAGANHDNAEQPLEKTMEVETKNASLQNSANSPFSDLYQMIKKSLDVKTPRKSSVSQLQTPSSRFCTPKPAVVRETGAEGKTNGTPQSAKKRRSSKVQPAVMAGPTVEKVKDEATNLEKTPSQATEQTKSPVRRRSREGTPAKPFTPQEQAEQPQRTSPRNLGKAESVNKGSKKRKSGEIETEMPTSETKRKRVSFGGYLSPELFDKRLPPALPLRKGATPRRSLTLLKPKVSLLRRASAIGLLNDNRPHIKSTANAQSPNDSKVVKTSPKAATPAKKSPKSSSSPKAVTPVKKSPKSSSSPKTVTPVKKSPKSPSPKAATPVKKSPKSTSSPKAVTPVAKSAESSPKVAIPVKKSPKVISSPKAETPAKKSPKSTPLRNSPRCEVQVSPSERSSGRKEKKQLSLEASNSAMEKDVSSAHQAPTTPVNSGVKTPSVQGRFSVSRISTPSPDADGNHASEQASSITVTPKLPLKRKSITKKTPRRSVQKVLNIRGSISRASLKVSNRWADIVKFGKPKAEVVASTKAMLIQRRTKKAVSKPQAKTPVRHPRGHVTTGHADSPATIVVGKAHKITVVHPTGAVPRVITNIALSKKNMKMDEDLSGISEMFKTPQNKKRRSVSKPETPAGGQAISLMGVSVLNTPEEPGEMVVSPLTVTSTAKSREYNSEAVQRLLKADEDYGYARETSVMELDCDISEHQTSKELTPKQQSETQECLTGVKRLMKTPKQKSETQECLTGVKRLMDTPKQKSETPECLTGVKKLMDTPKQDTENPECLTGVKRLMKTPKQDSETPQCLTGVKRLMKTPKQKPETPECLTGVKKLMETPKQKPERPECLTGVKRLMKTPKQDSETPECLTGVKQLMKTPKQDTENPECLTGVKQLIETPKQKPETPECLTGVKRLMKTPKQKSEPVEDLRGKLLKTPQQSKPEQQDCLSGMKTIFMTPQPDNGASEDIPTSPGGLSAIKRIMKTPKVKGAQVEDMVGLKRLLRTPKEKGQPVEENFGLKRLMKSPRMKSDAPVEDFSGLKELMDEPLPESDKRQVTSCHMINSVCEFEVPATTESEVEQEIDKVQLKTNENNDDNDQLENLSGSGDENVIAVHKKAVRGKKNKQEEPEEAGDEQDISEEKIVTAPVRGRRAKKMDSVALSTVRQSRSRNTKLQHTIPNVEVKDTTEIPVISFNQTSQTNVSEEKPMALEEESVEKPRKVTRGKKTTIDSTEPEPTEEAKHEEMSEAQPKLSDLSSSGKPRRGRKQKVIEQNEVTETVVIAETNQPLQAPPRARRGKNITWKEEKTAKESEVQPLEVAPTEVLPIKASEEAVEDAVTAKPKRGGRRPKQENHSASQESSIEVPKVVTNTVDKPKRGRRGKVNPEQSEPAAESLKQEVSEENETKQTVVEDNPKQEELEKIDNQPVVETLKPTKRKGARSVKNEPPQVIHKISDQEVVEEKDIDQTVVETVKPMKRRVTRAVNTKPPHVPQETPKQELVEEKMNQPVESLKQEVVEECEIKQPVIETVKRGRRGAKIENAKQPQVIQESLKQEVVEEKVNQPAVESLNQEVAEENEIKKPIVETVKPTKKRGARAVKPEPPPVIEDDPKQEELENTENQPVVETLKPTKRKGVRSVKTETPQVIHNISDQEVTEEKDIDQTTVETVKPVKKRGGRSVNTKKQVLPESPKQEVTEEKDITEAVVETVKSVKRRGAATVEAPQVVPAKRTRRGAAPPPEETISNSSVQAPEDVPVEPPRRGRRAAPAKTKTNEAPEDTNQAELLQDVSAVGKNAKGPKKCLRWKSEVQVHEIPEATPVKAVRGRKAKLPAQTETENKNTTEPSRAEEEQTVEPVEIPPAKRSKAAATSAKKGETTKEKKVAEAAARPKTRSGRLAKK